MTLLDSIANTNGVLIVMLKSNKNKLVLMLVCVLSKKTKAQHRYPEKN